MLIKPLLCTALLLVSAGCMTVQKVEPAQFIPQHHPSVVWVTANDNSYTPVSQPRIDGDSLKGFWTGPQDSVAISLNQIQSVQARMPSPKRTVILVTSLGVISTAVVYTLLTAGTSGSIDNGCPLDHNGQPQNFC